MTGPKTDFADQIHAEKYRLPGESFDEAMNRIAAALTESTEEYRILQPILKNQRFLPGGRVQAAVGTGKAVTAFNCYVSGTIEDSLVGDEAIMGRLTQAAATMQQGGGIGYDFSTLRPRGDRIKKLGSKSSGPISWMGPFNAMGLAISSAGHRRGAQMGVMRVDHPDIFEFLQAKHDQSSLTGFNISIGVTDEFMEAVKADGEFDLRFDGKVYETIRAVDLWEAIMRSTWDWAEPGVLFLDRINGENNLQYCETIAATNPCGEQPLPPFGACLLGSFNMTKYLEYGTDGWVFNRTQFRWDIKYVVRAMDRVTDISRYPLAEQRAEAISKRRMGLGVTGMANCIEAMGYRYGTEEYIRTQDSILEDLRNEAYSASADLALERGTFPLYSATRYGDSPYIRRMPSWLQKKIREQGLRNSHLLSIAPTGTISLTADNVSSGIEPTFSPVTQRAVKGFDGTEIVTIEDWAHAQGVKVTPCEDVTAQQHVDVLCAAQYYMDSAVSKTCNVSPDMPWEDFKNLYLRAWEQGAKGCTTFNPGGKRFGILTAAPKEGEACTFDPETGKTTCE